MKKVLLSLSLIACTFAMGTFTACETNTESVKTDEDTTKMGTQSSSDVAEDRNDAKMDGDVKDDADFCTRVAAANLAEIAALKSAISRSKNADVVKHARMMLTDHEKMGTDMKAYAAKKNITLPTEPDNSDKQALADLEKKTGADYDKEWADMMVEDHEDVVDLFEDNSTKRTDAELNTMIAKNLPGLKTHLDMSRQLDEKLDK